MTYSKVAGAMLGWIALSAPLFSQEEDASSSLLISMENRLSYLERTLAELRGKCEEIEKKLKDISSLSGDIKPAGTGPIVSSSPAPAVSAAGENPEANQPAAPSPVPTPAVAPADESQKLYDAARKLLNRQAYREAELAFQEVVSLYPKSPLVVNAKYWLGEIYLSRAEYDKAAVSFGAAYALYKKLPQGAFSSLPSKAGEALLKLAFALRGQGKKDEICVTLQQLKKEFPALYTSKKSLVDRAQVGLKCSQ